MKRRFFTVTEKRQRGYTLIEAGFAITLAAVIAAAGLTVVSKRADGFRVEKAQQEMKQWLEASMQFRRDTGAWPANAAALTTGNYMPVSSVTGPFGGSYTIAPVASNARVRITYDATQARFANLISAALPLASVTGTTVMGEVVVPGAEISHDSLLPRDGSRAMTGNLNMGGNSISGAANVTASGYVYTTSYMQADLFYDAYNSGYYVRPRSTSRMNEVHADRVYGFSDIRTPVLYDYNDTGYYVDPNNSSVFRYIYAYGDVRSSLMYDLNDYNYYLDPNGTSELYYVHARRIYDRTKGVDNDQAVHHVSLLGEGGAITKPSCYSWHSPTVYTSISSASDNATANPIGGIQTYAIDRGSYWTVHMRLYVAGSGSYTAPSWPYGKILAIAKCE
jgi:type II secretory pathway pseudopilin PulG